MYLSLKDKIKTFMNSHSDLDRFERMAEYTLKQLRKHLETSYSGDQPASGYAPLQKVLQALKVDDYIERGGMNTEQFEEFLQTYLKYSVQLHVPQHIAHQVSVPDYPGLLTGMINAVMNNPMAIFEMGPAASSLEFRIVNWMLEKIGWQPEPLPHTVPPTHDRSVHAAGVLVHGGSLANLTAMLAARARIAPHAWAEGTPTDLAIMMPKMSHYSNERAVAILGLGTNAIYLMDTNQWGVVDIAGLHPTLEKIRQDGKRCMAVIANACSTATGLHDPLAAMGKFCQQHKLWFHVDACHGASALLSDKYKRQLNGVELADSVVWDAHKMLQVPALAAAVLLKSGSDMDAAFHTQASYLAYGENREAYDSLSRTVECTKSSLSLKIFMNLAFRGEQGLVEYVESRYDMAKKFRRLILQRAHFIAPYEPETNILCFRYQGLDGGASNELQQHIRFELMRRKQFHITSTLINEVRYLRVTIMNRLTTESVLSDLLDEIELLAAELC